MTTTTQALTTSGFTFTGTTRFTDRIRWGALILGAVGVIAFLLGVVLLLVNAAQHPTSAWFGFTASAVGLVIGIASVGATLPIPGGDLLRPTNTVPTAEYMIQFGDWVADRYHLAFMDDDIETLISGLPVTVDGRQIRFDESGDTGLLVDATTGQEI